MYCKLNEKEKEIIQKASDLTSTDYQLEGDFINVDNLIVLVEDLVLVCDRLNECYRDLEQDIQDNYKPISKAEQYQVFDDDFI